ncbi:gtpase slip-gc [Fusarium coicis]|nr:gtpase slip-gc [Fusarium coicis]
MANGLLPSAIKRELPPELSPISDIAPVKRQTTESEAVEPPPVKFPWETCQDMNEFERNHIKEIAVEKAEAHCLKIQAVLESALGKTKGDASPTSALAIERNMFSQWLGELNNIRHRHQELEILIGVEGQTGAGKSSFLNALLGLSELFPSGQQGAATAVVGKASWNWDDKPESRFRAKVTLCDKADIEQTIKSLLKDMKQLSVLKSSTSADCDDPEAREDEITNTENRVKFEVPRIKAVWGMKRDDLQIIADTCTDEKSYDKAVQQILNKNRQACRFLQDGFVEFSTANKKELRNKIKPFLDSTAVKHGTETPFAIWPLIQDVHMYVKSNFLRPGMTVVDLPGCGDATASRGEIAKRFSHRLDVRLVVSHIVRATDEHHGQVLMQSGFEEAQMKIRGKYDGRGFGVVLSRTDDIEVETYIEDSDELQSDPVTSQKLKTLAELRNKEKSDSKKLKDNEGKLAMVEDAKLKIYTRYLKAMQDIVSGSQDQSKTHRERAEDLKKKEDEMAILAKRGLQQGNTFRFSLKNISQEIKDIENWLHDKATQTRNQYVKDRLQENHAIRQAALNRSDKGSPPLPIFPVSSKAYWRLKPKKSPIQSYTTRRSTGIPAVRDWLIEATFSKREKHLDDVLGTYRGLMTMMRFYSQEKGIDANFDISRSTVEDALAQTHRQFSTNLGTNLAEAAAMIRDLNPLEDVKRICKVSSNEAVRIAAKWSRKYPADGRKTDMMRSNTYAAILSRNGSTYTPKGTMITYNWVEDLDNLPALEVSFNNFAALANNIVQASSTSIQKMLDKLSEEASEVVDDTTELYGQALKPLFAAALEIKGKGSYKSRREFVASKVSKVSAQMAKSIVGELSKRLQDKKASVPGDLHKIAQQAINTLKQQLSFHLNNILENYPTNDELKKKKVELQKVIRVLVEEWEQDWQPQEFKDEKTMGLNLKGPEDIQVIIDDDDCESDKGEEVVTNTLETIGDDDLQNFFQDVDV